MNLFLGNERVDAKVVQSTLKLYLTRVTVIFLCHEAHNILKRHDSVVIVDVESTGRISVIDKEAGTLFSRDRGLVCTMNLIPDGQANRCGEGTRELATRKMLRYVLRLLHIGQRVWVFFDTQGVV